MTEFDIALYLVFGGVIGMLIFAPWWNARQDRKAEEEEAQEAQEQKSR